VGARHQLWSDLRSWNQDDLTARTGAPNAIAGSALAGEFDTRLNHVEVYYFGSNLRAYQLWWDGSWHYGDITSSAGAAPAAPGSPLGSQVDPIAQTVEVYYLDLSNHVDQLYWNGVWNHDDLTVRTGAPNAAAGSPLVNQIDTITNNPEAYFIGADQHVYELWFPGGWYWSDITYSAGAPNAVP
jgi:hypothetical protein